jgi:hypothetical protein
MIKERAIGKKRPEVGRLKEMTLISGAEEMKKGFGVLYAVEVMKTLKLIAGKKGRETFLQPEGVIGKRNIQEADQIRRILHAVVIPVLKIDLLQEEKMRGRRKIRREDQIITLERIVPSGKRRIIFLRKEKKEMKRVPEHGSKGMIIKEGACRTVKNLFPQNVLMIVQREVGRGTTRIKMKEAHRSKKAKETIDGTEKKAISFSENEENGRHLLR